MYEASQKILVCEAVLGDEFSKEQASIKNEYPDRVKFFEDRMEYFSTCAHLVGIYRNYLSSSAEYGASDKLLSAVEEKDGTISRFGYKKVLLEASENTGIRFGQTGYEERLKKMEFESAKKRYNDAMTSLREIQAEQENVQEGEFVSPLLVERKS